MARRKTRRRTRRRNPVRTTGMVLVNPRRRRKTTKRRRNTRTRARARRRTTRRRRRNPLVVRGRRVNPRRRNPRKRRKRSRKTVYRTRARRKNPSRRRRRSTRRRRNPRRKNPAAMLKKIPVIGPILAGMVAFLPQTILGGLSIEPMMMVTRFVGPYVPTAPASVLYAAAGLIVASLIQAVPSRMLSKANKDKLSVAVASASAGVGYYKWRTGMDSEAVTEAGMLEMSGAGSLGGLAGNLAGLIPGPGTGMYNPNLAGMKGGFAGGPVFVRPTALRGR